MHPALALSLLLAHSVSPTSLPFEPASAPFVFPHRLRAEYAADVLTEEAVPMGSGSPKYLAEAGTAFYRFASGGRPGLWTSLQSDRAERFTLSSGLSFIATFRVSSDPSICCQLDRIVHLTEWNDAFSAGPSFNLTIERVSPSTSPAFVARLSIRYAAASLYTLDMPFPLPTQTTLGRWVTLGLQIWPGLGADGLTRVYRWRTYVDSLTHVQEGVLQDNQVRISTCTAAVPSDVRLQGHANALYIPHTHTHDTQQAVESVTPPFVILRVLPVTPRITAQIYTDVKALVLANRGLNTTRPYSDNNLLDNNYAVLFNRIAALTGSPYVPRFAHT